MVDRAADERRRRVVVVTGLSGAGMSTVLKALEDLGHETVDNLPIGLVGPFLSLRDVPTVPGLGTDPGPVALTIDGRTRGFTARALGAAVAALRADPALDVRMVFVDCDREKLLQRYTETRRRHPLAKDRPVADGLVLEEALVGPVREHADLYVDTSLMTIHDLRRYVGEALAVAEGPSVVVTVTSFAFTKGLPREADLVFDVRFMDNPHWDPDLRPLTGTDPRVAARVEADKDFTAFFDGLTAMLGPLLPRYNREGKSYLTIAIGCTGGKHRSVVVAGRLGSWFEDSGYRTTVVHRDMPMVSGPDGTPTPGNPPNSDIPRGI
ncbi:RNase adapter RapZ [Fodinicurvata sp. EGI_FJ10296]|uniref:RNase adapter RapZ n=1 Tax=Fodinicurvata sp. EGI_FJ10296 TaxID=3231908 RepID=UPI0034547BD3